MLSFGQFGVAMDLDAPHLEQFLDWQVNACGGDGAAGLWQLLKKNRDCHMRQAEYVEREVSERRMRRCEADDYRFIRACLTAERAFKFTLKETILKAHLERNLMDYRNKKDGTALEVPEVNEEKLTDDLRRSHTNKLQEICSSQ
jgi:hypothetical protein